MHRVLLLDVVAGESAAMIELLAGKYEALMVRGNAPLVLNFVLDCVDGVGGLHLQSDCLCRERPDENLDGGWWGRW